MNTANLYDYLRTALESEWSHDFPRLEQIPSTTMRMTVRYCRSLPATEKRLLMAAAAKKAAQRVTPVDEKIPASWTPDDEQCLERLAKATYLSGNIESLGTRALRYLRGLESQKHNPLVAGLPADLIQQITQKAETVIPTKVKDIRRQLKQDLLERFDAKAYNEGGGEWLYAGTLNSTPIMIRCSFGDRLDMLQYGVATDFFISRHHLNYSSYESLLGLGLGSWDAMEEKHLVRDISLLMDLCAKTGKMLMDMEQIIKAQGQP
jgi:hypothetical protein